MLKGRVFQFRWGTRRELLDTWRHMAELYPGELTGLVYGRRPMGFELADYGEPFGVKEDSSLQEGVWLFETTEEVHQSPDKAD
jgi:hypothetical protein